MSTSVYNAFVLQCVVGFIGGVKIYGRLVHQDILSGTEEPLKAGTCARDRRALQQLALSVHVKHSDLT